MVSALTGTAFPEGSLPVLLLLLRRLQAAQGQERRKSSYEYMLSCPSLHSTARAESPNSVISFGTGFSFALRAFALLQLYSTRKPFDTAERRNYNVCR